MTRFRLGAGDLNVVIEATPSQAFRQEVAEGMADAIYPAVATARGAGRNGEVTSSDGVIDESLAIPKEMGGPGGDKQLFAAGYSACFHSALQAVARGAKVTLPESTVTAEVSLYKQDPGFQLGVALHMRLPGLDKAQADELVARAHQLCPYSNATRGNIEVTLATAV